VTTWRQSGSHVFSDDNLRQIDPANDARSNMTNDLLALCTDEVNRNATVEKMRNTTRETPV